jgi:hypothetical protein
VLQISNPPATALPVVQSNIKAAKALELNLPEKLLALADEVIEECVNVCFASGDLRRCANMVGFMRTAEAPRQAREQILGGECTRCKLRRRPIEAQHCLSAPCETICYPETATTNEMAG